MRRLFILLFLLWCLRAEEDTEEYRNKPKKRKHESRRIIKCARSLSNDKNVSLHIAGDICCDSELDSLLRQMSFKIHNDTNLGDAARRIQKRSQFLHEHSFEVILSEQDFAVSSYYRGQRLCKIKSNDYYVLAYQTPGKNVYNISDNENEMFLASIDSQEPLGSTLNIDREEWPDIDEDELADVGAGTHCKRDRRDGNKCCSKEIYNVMKTVVDEVSTSPVFETARETQGVVANVIKKRVQQRFARIFEVIVSKDDFVQATYFIGDFTCKIFRKGLYMMAFEAPHQSGYHPYDKNEEADWAGLSDAEPLGTPLLELPGQIDLNKGVELETDGYRLGFPKDSHCDHGRSDGMKCCHMELFQSMHGSIMGMKGDETFNTVDRRTIAQRMRKSAEEAINEPLEMIIADGPFHVASQHEGDCTCKFKADQYHIMAWRTPGNYSIGMDQFADNGHTQFVGCNKPSSALDGATCCNQTLRYSITKTLHESSNLDFSDADTRRVTRALQKAAQEAFNARVEVTVSRGNFIWNSPEKREKHTTCKLDLFQYHALIFQSDVIPHALTPEEAEGGFEEFERPLDFKPGGGGGAGGGSGGSGSGGSGGDGQGQGSGQGNSNANNANSNNNNANSNANNNAASSNDRNGAADAQNAANQVNAARQAQALDSQIAQQQALQQQINALQQQAMTQGLSAQQQAQLAQLQAEAARNAAAIAANSMAMPPPLFGGGFACFTGETTVTTPEGERAMTEVEIGDFVLTANHEEAYFTPVTQWLHRDPEESLGYYRMTTSSGRVLNISPKHYIYRSSCRDINTTLSSLPESGETYAYMVEVGDCLYVYDEGVWILEEVVASPLQRRKGAYAPLTSNGRILVNSILSSCYSGLNDQTLINTYMEVALRWQRRFRWLYNWLSDEDGGLPYFANFYEQLLYVILPTFTYYSR